MLREDENFSYIVFKLLHILGMDQYVSQISIMRLS